MILYRLLMIFIRKKLDL